MKWFANTYLEGRRGLNILDVGSYNVNGNYRDIFEQKGHRYIGLDMEEGPNVDIKPNSTYEWDEIVDDSYDVVVSGQAFEHIEYFWVIMEEMVRVTKKDGLICIIAPQGFEEHRYPVDCWRFFTDGMVALARYCNLELLHAHTNRAPSKAEKKWYSEKCADTMLIARKNYSGRTRRVSLKDYKCIPEAHSKICSGFEKAEVNNEATPAEKSEEKKRLTGTGIKKRLSRLKKVISETWRGAKKYMGGKTTND